MIQGDTRVLVRPPTDYASFSAEVVQEETSETFTFSKDTVQEIIISTADKRTKKNLVIIVEKNARVDLQVVLTAVSALHELTFTITVAGTLNMTFIQDITNTSSVQVNRTVHVTGSVFLHDVLFGGLYTDVVSRVYLEAKGAVGKQSATIFGDGQRFQLNQQSYHVASETESDIKTKAVLQNATHVGCKGLVAIAPQASKSSGYQQMDVLMLDDASRASAIPELAIQTDEVSCSHGATIGELDKEQLFYLQSRGLTYERAVHLLLIGFLSQDLQHLPEEQQKHILQKIEARLAQ